MELPGPDREVLRKLANDMPGMIKDLEDQRALKGKKSAMVAKPTRVCQICGKGFDFKMVTGQLPEVDQCGHCTECLKSGHIAFVSDNRFAIVDPRDKDGRIPPDCINWCGKIVHCEVDHMDRIELRYKVKTQNRDNAKLN